MPASSWQERMTTKDVDDHVGAPVDTSWHVALS